MTANNLRSLLAAAVVLCTCVTWTASRHHTPESSVIPGGEGEGWDEWGMASACSRTCGGGVASQKRMCLKYGSDGQPQCSGGDTKYFSCQTQDCPEGSIDFRAEQCSEFNDKEYDGVKYEWIPYNTVPNPCELNCMPRGETFLYKHGAKAIDGTRCYDDSFDVCVDGQCQTVGCDMMLGSKAREDKCRECRGNGTTCHTTSGLFDSRNLLNGYKEIVLLPEGATTILIETMAPSMNSLSLRAKNGTYYLNGHNRIDLPKSVVIAGALWHYEHSHRRPGLATLERLQSLGPINEPLHVAVYLREDNVGIQYEYSVPGAAASHTDIPETTIASTTEYTDTSEPSSVSESSRVSERSSVSESNSVTNPSSVGESNIVINPSTVGESNIVINPSTVGESNIVTNPSSVSESNIVTNPSTLGESNIVTNPSSIGESSSVPNPSSVGESSNVSELSKVSEPGSDIKLSTSIASDASVRWVEGPWNPCYHRCGEEGTQSRSVSCQEIDANGNLSLVADSECFNLLGLKPELFKKCSGGTCPQWLTKSWKKCDKQCGEGKQIRLVVCCLKVNGHIELLEDEECTEEKPEDMKTCFLQPCEAEQGTTLTSTILQPTGNSASEISTGSSKDSDVTSITTELLTTVEDWPLEDCWATKFGCCYDNETAATEANGLGCPCNATEFGCCPDGMAPAEGPDQQGCEGECWNTEYGCCGDGETPAHGPHLEGCCLLTAFGCCPDNHKPAEGPQLKGCGCQSSPYGCCPDHVTAAAGPNNKGCGCKYTRHGCCPDRHTEATGPGYKGCPCSTFQYGCCDDGITVAEGPEQQGCRCRTLYGCCGDGETPASSPNGTDCSCAASQFGCCPDGTTQATGPKFRGCTDKPENKQAVCSLPKNSGSCNTFKYLWFYNNNSGKCTLFPYGGCGGNGNRFATKVECEKVCVHPAPKDACKLPAVKGPCKLDAQRWHFDSAREQCTPFYFSGCNGNANNFMSRELCQAKCEPDTTTDQCSLPIEKGSCAGAYNRWGYSKERRQCVEFKWGGCEGNHNRFRTEAACRQRCSPPSAPSPRCTQAQDHGNCTEKVALWSFSQRENRCVPFYYSGCGGNDNRFDSRTSCEQTCPSAYEPNKCTLPYATGECATYRKRWFYDTFYRSCREFYYGGCGGNANKFWTEAECTNTCSETQFTPTTTLRPHNPNINAPVPVRHQTRITVPLGGKATLRCTFRSSWRVRITWWRGGRTIASNVDRYRLLSDGALEIVGLRRRDAGPYVCVADNGYGVARQDIHLEVSDPVPMELRIAGDKNEVKVGQLGRPLEIRCLAYGYPPPLVNWYHGRTMVPVNDQLYSTRGNTLQIKQLAIDNLGVYTCWAHNTSWMSSTKPRSISWEVAVKAYRPKRVVFTHKYLVPPVYKPTTTTTTTTTELVVQYFNMPVSAHIETPSAPPAAGGELSLTCEVYGFPEPEVYWTKDNVRLNRDNRTSISDNIDGLSRLTVAGLDESDGGLYACHAENDYTSNIATTQIIVTQEVAPAKCTDNPAIANCALIVRNKLCQHEYLSNCCKSCMEAAQLAEDQPSSTSGPDQLQEEVDVTTKQY